MVSQAEYLALEDPNFVTRANRLTNPDQQAPPSSDEILERLTSSGRVIGIFPGGSGSGSNAAAYRAIAMKRLDIERKKLEFQKKTGLRDIGQAREKGLRAAINNALQRGIFRSGIREFNVNEVEREAGEARTDLASNIQFALDDLKLRRENVQLGASSGGGGGGSGGSLTQGEALKISEDKAITERQRALDAQRRQSNIGIREGKGQGSGVVPITPPPTTPGRPF